MILRSNEKWIRFTHFQQKDKFYDKNVYACTKTKGTSFEGNGLCLVECEECCRSKSVELYVFTQSLYHGQDVTKGHFLTGLNSEFY